MKIMKYVIPLALFLTLTLSISAQVTIGSGNPPEEGALLDLKTLNVNDADPQDITTDDKGGGLLLPRVQLLTKEDPFFLSSTEPKIGNKKKRLTGLLVYNMANTSDGLTSGICIWDGNEWKNIANGDATQQQAWLMAGNTGIDKNKHFLGTTDNKPFSFRTSNTIRFYISEDGMVGIGTMFPDAPLYVLGDMTLTNTPFFPESTPSTALAIRSDGKIGFGKIDTISTKVTFVESSLKQPVSSQQINSSTDVLVSWTGATIAPNNLTTFDQGSQSFVFNENALCEVSGHIMYKPDAILSQYSSYFEENGAALNVILQYMDVDDKKWVNLSAARAIWVGGSAKDVSKTVNIPPAIRAFKKNDKIRMVINRPSSIRQLNHQVNNNGGIIGSTYNSKVKSIRIVSM